MSEQINKMTRSLADLLHKAGWRASCDAQYTELHKAIGDIRRIVDSETITVTRSQLVELLAPSLSDAHDSTRDWSAWSYGTMTQDDFTPVNERLAEIVEEVFDAATSTKVGAK